MTRAALQHVPQSSGKAPTAATSLRIGPAHDSLEQEAEQAAERVTSREHKQVAWSLSRVGLGTGEGPVQRQCSCGASSSSGGECEECKKKTLQRRASGGGVSAAAPPIVHEVLRSPGQPLEAKTRAFMEPRFGQDFSKVRIHTGSRAAESALAVQARAYTVGKDIVFGAAQYAPGTAPGNKLLAHELTHVVQQGGMQTNSSSALRVGRPDSLPEQQAEQLGVEVLNGSKSKAKASTVRIQPVLQRQPTGNLQGLDWRELARRQVPWQQWTLQQKEGAEADYHAELRKLKTPADMIDFLTPPYQNEVKRLLAPYGKDMGAFAQMKTGTSLDLSASFVSTLRYTSPAGKPVTLSATVALPSSANPNPPTGEVMFEVFKQSVGQVDLTRVQSTGTCVTTQNSVLGPSVNCTAKATYVTIPLSKGQYQVKATYQPLNTGARSSYTEVFLDVK